MLGTSGELIDLDGLEAELAELGREAIGAIERAGEDHQHSALERLTGRSAGSSAGAGGEVGVQGRRGVGCPASPGNPGGGVWRGWASPNVHLNAAHDTLTLGHTHSTLGLTNTHTTLMIITCT